MAERSIISDLENLIKTFVQTKSSENQVKESKIAILKAIQTATTKELIEMSRSIDTIVNANECNQSNIKEIQKIINDQMESQMPMKSPYQTPEKKTQSVKLLASNSPNLPESARKSVASLCLGRTLEKKLIKNLFSTIQNIKENSFASKLNETTQRTNYTDNSPKTKIDLNRLTKGLMLISEATLKKDLEYKMFYKWKAYTFVQTSSNMNTSVILGEYYKKHTHSPLPSSRGAISNLTSKFPEKNNEYAQKQSIQFLHKVGVGIIAKVVLLHVTKCFCKIREYENIKKASAKIREVLLKILINKDILEARKSLMNSFHKWRTHSISNAFTKGRITNKVKGRMLLSLSKKQSSISLETALLRWKVKSDPSFIRKAIEKFAFNSKLTPHLALWKMKAGAAARKEKIDRESRSNFKLIKGLENLAGIFQRYNHRQLTHALVNIDEYKFTLALRKKSIMMFRRYIQRGLVQAMEKWKQACIQSLLFDLRKKAVKGFARAPNHLALAFSKWKQHAVHEKSKIEKSIAIRSIKFVDTLQSLRENWEKTVFEKLRGKVRKHVLVQQMTQNLVFRIKMKLKQSLFTWREQLFNSKMKKQQKAENIQKIFEFMKLRRKLELQKAIHAVRINHLTDYHKNQRLTMLVVHSLTTKMRNSLRIWHLKKDLSKHLDISKKSSGLFAVLAQSLRQNTNLIFERDTVNKQYVSLKKLVEAYKSKLNLGFIKWKTETKTSIRQNIGNREKSIRFISSLLQKPVAREQRIFFDLLLENVHSVNKVKSSSVAQLLHKIQRKYEFSFKTWKHETKNEIERTRRKNLQGLIELMQDQLKYNTQLLYRNDQEKKKKVAALKKMSIIGFKLLSKSFSNWKTKTAFLKLENNLYNSVVEKNVEKMGYYLQEKISQSLRDSFNFIKQTSTENKVKKRSLLNFVKNTNGIMFYYFDKWRKTPKNSYLHEQKGIVIMDKILMKIFHRNMKLGLEPLKDEWHEIEKIKRKAILQFIHRTEDKVKVSFHIWAQKAMDVKKTLAIRSMFTFFETLKSSLKSNLTHVLVSDQIARKREEIIKKMISIVDFKKKFSFEKWKNHMISKRFRLEIATEKKKRVAFGLVELLDDVRIDTLRNILSTLQDHQREIDLKTRVFNSLMRTRMGKIFRAFELWKRLPSKRLIKKKESSAQLVEIFEEILRNKKKSGFDQIKDLWYEARDIKKKAIRQFQLVSSNKKKLAIDKWKNNTIVENHILKCKQVISFFDILSSAVKTNLSVITYFDMNAERKVKTIKKLMGQRKLLMSIGFDKWRRFNERVNVQEMFGNQKKDFMLNRLERYAIKGLLIRKGEGFKGFQEWKRISNLKIKVLKHLLNTRAGKIAKAFDVWKRLPTKRELQKLNSIADLDGMLRKLEMKRKMQTFDDIKKLWIQSREIKKACIKKWIYLSLNKRKRIFSIWAQNTEKIKTIQNCRNVTHLFETLTQAIKGNTNLFFNKGFEAEKKIEVLKKIIANAHSKRVQFFNTWHKFTIESRFIEHIIERNKDLSTEKIFNTILSGYQNQLKIGFDAINSYSVEMIDKKKIILALKKTLFYKLSQSFGKWKNTSIQIKKVKENSSKSIEVRLNNLLKAHLKIGFDSLKKEYQLFKNHTNNTARRVLLMWTAKQRKATLKWKNYVDITKKEERLRDVQNLFEVLRDSAKYNTLELYTQNINYEKKKNSSKLLQILTRIFNYRIKHDFNRIHDYHNYVINLKLGVLKTLDRNSNSVMRDSLDFWRDFTAESKKASNIKNALVLFGNLENSLKKVTSELYDYDPIDYGKKMVLKQLYHNWSTRKSALFNRWKEAVNKQKLLEKALTFGKIIITCRKNREYVLKEALRFWRRNNDLLKFKDITAKQVKQKDISTRSVAAISRIEAASSKFLLRSFKQIQIFAMKRQLLNLVFSKLEERHIYLKNTGFERIKAVNKQNYGMNVTKKILNASILLNRYASRQVGNAFSRIKELKSTHKKILRLGDIFKKGLSGSLNKWRLTGKSIVIQRMNNICMELQDEVKETQRQSGHHQDTLTKMNALNTIFLNLEKALAGSLLLGTDAMKANKVRWEKKAIFFNRMEQVAKFKKSYVFEIWKSMCTEKLLKSFYDTILLEKSLMKYTSNLKFYAFHRIRTSGILEYWRTYNNALWKWKLSNVEARYYTQQNTFLKQAKSVSIMKLIIEVTQRNVLRDAFMSVYNHKLRDEKEVKGSFRSLEKIYKDRLSQYFSHIKMANTINYYEEDIKMNKLAAGLNRLGNVFNRDKLKDRVNVFSNIQQKIYQNSKIQRMTTVFDKFLFNQQFFAFGKLKQLLFVDKKSYVNLKAQTLGKYLDLYQDRLARSAISRIKNYLLLQRKLVSVRNSLSHILAKCKGRGILRKWLVKSRLRDQIKATKFVKMISLIGKNREHILRRALRKWSFKRGKNVLDIFYLVMSRNLQFTYKNAFDKLRQRVEMFKYLNKVLATQKIMRFTRLFQEYKTFIAFKTWHERAKNYNPWFKRSVALVAKNSKINYQIAFWRLKDAVKVEGSNLTASKVVKCKKIINFVKKLYEMNIAKAFWMIERKGNGEQDDRHGSGKKSRIMDTPDKKNQERDDQMKKKLLKSVIGRIVRKYGPTRKNILSSAFSKWCMKAGIGRKVVMQKLADSMQDFEMDYVAKYGAIHIIFNTFKGVATRQMKFSFEKISNYNSNNGVLNHRNWNDESGDLADGDKNFLIERHQELLNAYEEKSRHLEQAYQSLTHLSNRLNAMITTKFVKILNKYRVVNMLEAFESLRDNGV